MALEHPRYFIKHGGVHSHELLLQPRGDSDYGLRTKTLCSASDPCLVTDKDGKPIVWDLDVGHNDHVELSYPFSVSVSFNGVSETLLSCSEDVLMAHPIALPLHEDLEIRLGNMVEEAKCIEEEGLCTREELKTLMAQPFEEHDIEEMCHGSFFSYFSALHDHHGIRVMLKFEHIPTDDGEGFVLHFRAAKILVPHGRHLEDFFRHEHSISALEAQNRIVKAILENSYEICGEMVEDRHTRATLEEVSDEALQVNKPVRAVMSSISKAAKGAGSAFSKAAKSVGRTISRSSVGKAVGRAASSAGRLVGRGASAVASSRLGQAVGGAATRLKTAVSSAAGRVSDTATRVKTSVTGSSLYQKVSTKATEAKDMVSKKFGDVKTSVQGARDKVKDRLKGPKDSVRDKVQSLRGKRTGGSASASKASSSSAAVPQDKSAPVTGPDGSSRVAGVGTSGDPRAPGAKPDRFKGQAGSAAPPPKAPPPAEGSGKAPQAPPKPSRDETKRGKAEAAAKPAEGSDKAPRALPKPSRDETKRGKAEAAAKADEAAPGAAKSGGPPRRHGEKPKASDAPSQAPIKPADDLGKYETPSSAGRVAPPKELPKAPTAGAAKSSAPSDPAPKPAADAKSSFTKTTTDAKGATRFVTTTNKGDGTSKVVSTKIRPDGTTKVTRTKTAADGTVATTDKRDTRAERRAGTTAASTSTVTASKSSDTSPAVSVTNTNTADGASRTTATTARRDGTTKTITSKTRADGTTKVTTTKTAADGTVLSSEKHEYGAAAKSGDADTQKTPKDKKPGVLSKLKDKYDQRSQGRGGSADTGRGSDSGGAGVSAGAGSNASTGQGDSAVRPDYDRQMREDARQQDAEKLRDRDNMPPETINFGRRKEDAGSAVLAGVAAGAVTGALVAAASSPPIAGQRLPPGYVLTANGVMALGPDGRVYPLTADQAGYLQQYQGPVGMAQPGVAGASTPAAPPPPTATSNQENPATSQFTPTPTIRLADDDEPLSVQDTSPPLRRVPEQQIADDINETQDQQRRDVLIKYLVGQHGVLFGRTPTKQQKDKLRARIMAIQRPFIMTKVIDQYASWLVESGVKYT